MRKTETKKHSINKLITALAFCVVLISCVLFVAVQSASAGNKLQDTSSFGIGNDRCSVDTQVGVISNNDYQDGSKFETTSSSLATYTTRDITTALSSISFKIESAAKAAAEAARLAELIKSNEAKNNRNAHSLRYSMPSGLSEVNWDVSKDAFMAEWTSRINKYLAGSSLANMGEFFAAAAWENGIDPRWSPAISNTESTKGAYCFASHNAWGWGNSGWSSWPEAINAHVSGLAEHYGYTITPEFAQKYCPPNHEHWYESTLYQMELI